MCSSQKQPGLPDLGEGYPVWKNFKFKFTAGTPFLRFLSWPFKSGKAVNEARGLPKQSSNLGLLDSSQHDIVEHTYSETSRFAMGISKA